MVHHRQGRRRVHLGRHVADRAGGVAPAGVELAKRTMSATSGLEEALAAEAERQMRCFRSADAKEGISAFNEKRRPVFRGE